MFSRDPIDHMLETTKPTLTTKERELLWQKVEARIEKPVAIPSPYLSSIHSRTMTSLIIALIVILGAGGTVAVSEAAKPGDLLFPIERATERARLALASDERAAELRSKFAQERLVELQDIIDEEVTVSNEVSTITATSSEAVRTFEAEADVFTDITVVKVEINDRKSIFTTSVTSRAEVVLEIARRFGVEVTVVETALNFEVEDRASRPGERGTVLVDDSGEERISVAVNVFLDLLEEFDDAEKRAVFLTALMSEINSVSVAGRNNGNVDIRTDDSRIKIKDDRIEIREDGYRVKIDKDGEIKVKVEDDSRSNEDEDEDEENELDDDSRFNSSASTTNGLKLEVEADIFTDTTVVEVELNDQKTTFTTTAKTKEEIAAEVVRRYGVDQAVVLAVLKLEIEDRASRSDDQAEDEDEDDRDDSGSDEDDDEDEEDDEDGEGSDNRDDDDDDDDDSRGSDDDRDEANDDDNATTNEIKEFEVEVKNGVAQVKVEYGSKELEYEATYTTKAALIADVATRTGLASATLQAALKLEFDN